jgi:hypothetical protein
MSRWLSRMWQAGEAATHVHSVVSLGAIVLGVFSALVAAMTAVLRSIPDLLPWHRWGVYVLLAIGLVFALLFLLLIVSFIGVLIYGLYRRLRGTRERTPDSATPTTDISVLAAISPHHEIERATSILQKYIDTRFNKVEQLEKEIAVHVSRFEQQDTMLHREIDAARSSIGNTADEIRAALTNEASERISSYKYVEGLTTRAENSIDKLTKEIEKWNYLANVTREQLNTRFNILYDHLAARDALAIITTEEKVVLEIGSKLFRANAYQSQEAWSKDYDAWHKSISRVEYVVSMSGLQGFPPLLNIGRRELEECAFDPPDFLRTDTTTSIRYQTVAIAHQRYLEARSKVLQYFDQNSGSRYPLT